MADGGRVTDEKAAKTDILTLTKCFFVPKLDHSISTVTREK